MQLYFKQEESSDKFLEIGKKIYFKSLFWMIDIADNYWINVNGEFRSNLGKKFLLLNILMIYLSNYFNKKFVIS